MQELDQNNEAFETESNATMETISDTFSEYESGSKNFEQKTARLQNSFATSDGTSLGSYFENETRHASFESNKKSLSQKNL
jgi:hypothetical protein